MGAPQQFPYPHRCPGPLGALRLTLDIPVMGVAGMWWPHSRDLTREGPHLANCFPPERGRIERLVYSMSDWRTAASELFTEHGRIKVGYFPRGQGRGEVLLRLAGPETIRLHVRWLEDAQLPAARLQA